MAFMTRANLLTWIAAKFPKLSMANPTNSDMQDLAVNMLDSSSQSSQAAKTATADGLTTGLVAVGEQWLPVTSASANNIVTLPDLALVSPGYRVRGYVGANGFKLSTPATSNQLINNVDSDGTQRAAIPANSMFEVTAIDATVGWILLDETRLGARTAAIVPA